MKLRKFNLIPPHSFFLLFCTFFLGCKSSAPFFPIGLYDVPASHFPAVAAAGFNTVVSSANRTNLDAAAENHLNVIAQASLTDHRLIRALDPHPALRAWYLYDEPDLSRLSPDKVAQMNAQLKRLARKPTLLVLMSGLSVEKYRATADLVAVDWYPIPWAPVGTVAREMRLARIARNGRPFYSIIQAFDWNSFPQLLRTDVPLRPPTSAEIRCMSYLSLMQGAAGLFYYTYDNKTWHLPDHPELWESLSSLAQEIGKNSPIFQERIDWWPVQSKYHGPPAEMYNEVFDARVHLSLFRVRKDSGSVRAGYYIIAANTSPSSADFSFNLPFEGVESVDTTCPPSDFQVEDAWLRKTYAPFEVCIFGPIPGKMLD